jgi:hypothetical protein
MGSFSTQPSFHLRRKTVENAMKKGNLRLLVATSTPSTAVDIPGIDVVIVRDGRTWAGKGFQRMGSTQFMQMIGRPGRGQARSGKSYYVQEEIADVAHFGDLARLEIPALEMRFRSTDAFQRVLLECLYAQLLPYENPLSIYCRVLYPQQCAVASDTSLLGNGWPLATVTLGQRGRAFATAGRRWHAPQGCMTVCCKWQRSVMFATTPTSFN